MKFPSVVLWVQDRVLVAFDHIALLFSLSGLCFRRHPISAELSCPRPLFDCNTRELSYRTPLWRYGACSAHGARRKDRRPLGLDRASALQAEFHRTALRAQGKHGAPATAFSNRRQRTNALFLFPT
jgi:hypothetical protein